MISPYGSQDQASDLFAIHRHSPDSGDFGAKIAPLNAFSNGNPPVFYILCFLHVAGLLCKSHTSIIANFLKYRQGHKPVPQMFSRTRGRLYWSTSLPKTLEILDRSALY